MCIDIHRFDKTVCSFFPLLFLPFWVSENSLSTMIKLFSFQRLLFYIHVSHLHGVLCLNIWCSGNILCVLFRSVIWVLVCLRPFSQPCLLCVFFAPSSQLGWDSLHLLLLQMYAGELVPPDCLPGVHFQNNLDYFGTFMSCYF